MDYTVRIANRNPSWYTMRNCKELSVIRHAKRDADMIGSTEFTIMCGDRKSDVLFGKWKRINGIWKKQPFGL